MAESPFRPSKSQRALAAQVIWEAEGWTGTPFWCVDARATSKTIFSKSILGRATKLKGGNAVRFVRQLKHQWREAEAAILGPVTTDRTWGTRHLVTVGQEPLAERGVNAHFVAHVRSLFTDNGTWLFSRGSEPPLVTPMLIYSVNDKPVAAIAPLR